MVFHQFCLEHITPSTHITDKASFFFVSLFRGKLEQWKSLYQESGSYASELTPNSEFQSLRKEKQRMNLGTTEQNATRTTCFLEWLFLASITLLLEQHPVPAEVEIKLLDLRAASSVPYSITDPLRARAHL